MKKSNHILYVIGFLLIVVFLSTSVYKSSSLQFKDYPISGIPSKSYLEKKAKCFQCENQIARDNGIENVGATHATKCFTCGDNPLLWRDNIMKHKKPIIGI